MLCANESCRRWFAPNTERQRYCSRACYDEAYNEMAYNNYTPEVREFVAKGGKIERVPAAVGAGTASANPVGRGNWASL